MRLPDSLIEDHLGQTPRGASDDAVVSVTGTSAESGALTAGTYRISATIDCWIKVGTAAAVTAAVATAGNAFLAAGVIDYLTVHATGVIDSVAAIKDTGQPDGKLSVTRSSPTAS
jgi:hypothetical protein